MKNGFRIVLLGVFAMFGVVSLAQTSSISGHVNAENSPVPFANVYLSDTEYGTTTDLQGAFEIKGVAAGEYEVRVSAIGYVPVSVVVSIAEGEAKHEHFHLSEDVFNLSQAVITGSRNAVERHNAPVIVNTIDAKIFESTQSQNISQGLSFSPGLRVENNCQNCGFTQLRMNGLDGAYSQILINSRPILSALAGVYGLEMLPSSMVDRIEIVRGGGSVMFGGNAIAGTVNIITKDPLENTFEVGLNNSLINGEASDVTANFNGSVVSEDLKKGIAFFGLNRNTEAWDSNDDGLTEVVQLKNTTIGFDAFYKLSQRKKLKVGGFAIQEFRRGGSDLDLLPHQSEVAEQLSHSILNGTFSYEQSSQDDKQNFTLYGSAQTVHRDSYFGGGGRVIAEGDSLTADDILAINAYGVSEDFSSVSGAQYNFSFRPNLTFTAGTEYIYNEVDDQMPGYERSIVQDVGAWGTFAEVQLKPLDKLTVLAGGRYDKLKINGEYTLGDGVMTNVKDLDVFVPRFTAMYSFKENMKLRASFAQGYRGPQAHDEALHIETVGGAARFVSLSPDLEVERSNSTVISLNYDKYTDSKQMNLVAEAFYTRLENPFVFADQEELPSGVSVITKRNGDGATLAGINLEANIALNNKWVIQSGATLQRAEYDVEEVIWSSEDTLNLPSTSTSKLLRTPNVYGYSSVVFSPNSDLSFSYSGVFTGAMDVAHVIDPETERTIIETTPVFFEHNLKCSYAFAAGKDGQLEVFGGVKNLLNSYQDDFDLGADRDAGYVYGPLRPRTFYAGLKFSVN